MSMSVDQRDARPVYTATFRDDVRVVSARVKYDRRYRMLAVEHAGQTVAEFNQIEREKATAFADGYAVALTRQEASS